MTRTLQVALISISTFVLVGTLTLWMRKLALKLNFVDRPYSAHKSHVEPIPYLGGVAIIIGVFAVTFFAYSLQGDLDKYFWEAAAIFAPALALGIIGLVDDYKTLQPFPRFLAQTASGVFTSIFLIATDTVGSPTGSMIFDVLITIFWVVGITNAINFFDNVDGGAAGTVAAAALGIFAIAQSNSQLLIATFANSIFAAMLGFLIWNKSPAKIFMGDAGSLFLGTILAALTIRLNPDVDNKIGSFSIPILLLAVPILDTSVAILSRIRRSKSIFEGGRDHLSHRLNRIGYSKKQTVGILWSLSIFFSGVATLSAIVETILVPLALFSALLWLTLLFTFLLTSDE